MGMYHLYRLYRLYRNQGLLMAFSVLMSFLVFVLCYSLNPVLYFDFLALLAVHWLLKLPRRTLLLRELLLVLESRLHFSVGIKSSVWYLDVHTICFLLVNYQDNLTLVLRSPH